MGYRDDLIKRLRDSGEWDTFTPEQRRRIEQLDDEKARVRMAAEDALESGFLTYSDDELDQLNRVGRHLAIADTIRAFGGRLLVIEPGKAPRLSELGQALADFIATAKGRGFSSVVEIGAELSKVTDLCLMLVADLAETDQA